MYIYLLVVSDSQAVAYPGYGWKELKPHQFASNQVHALLQMLVEVSFEVPMYVAET